MGTKLDFSTAYHPQTDGQTERINQVMEDMLRACALTYGTNWEASLPFAEFSYNNGRQASLGMAPFEALYGKKCRTPLMWHEVGERSLVGPALIKEAEEKVAEVRARLKEAQSRQKSYADGRRRELSFEEGDSVYLKVSPIRGTKRFQIKGKLAPRYIGPYKVVRRIGKVAYKLELPESMRDIHDVFHVSQLRKCLKVPDQQINLTAEELQPDLVYQERPIKILDTVARKTRTTTTKLCRVLWSRHGEEEATWEREDALRKEHPHLFENQPDLEDEISSKRGSPAQRPTSLFLPSRMGRAQPASQLPLLPRPNGPLARTRPLPPARASDDACTRATPSSPRRPPPFCAAVAPRPGTRAPPQHLGQALERP
ncbi:hypothetical protein U9M48_029002 [Paspalum notatum var. saurae]|uniref:Integrase catalytic domain-containing protein n=1 Tax=Paspalum notatum var. saurae TaxID=547442 RepID=A0AAQ3TXX3_PASNO